MSATFFPLLAHVFWLKYCIFARKSLYSIIQNPTRFLLRLLQNRSPSCLFIWFSECSSPYVNTLVDVHEGSARAFHRLIYTRTQTHTYTHTHTYTPSQRYWRVSRRVRWDWEKETFMYNFSVRNNSVPFTEMIRWASGYHSSCWTKRFFSGLPVTPCFVQF